MSSMREMKPPFFILAGNGSYDNRGCEAIVKGTVVILRHYFDKPEFLVASNYQTNSQFEQQRINEKDEAVIHVKTILAQKRFEPIWFLLQSLRFLYPMGMNYLIYKEMKIMPKNHNDRFSLLEKYFLEIYNNVSELFKTYIKSYNLRLNENDAIKIKDYANGLKNLIISKK